MTQPIVYIDRSDVRPSKLDELKAALRELAAFVEANEPRIISYACYVDEDARAVNVVHTHPDADSLRFHLEVAGPRFAPFADLLTLRSIDVYGEPDADTRKRLFDKAELLGGATVSIHPFQAGFLRG